MSSTSMTGESQGKVELRPTRRPQDTFRHDPKEEATEKKKAQGRATQFARPPQRARPMPVQAIEMKHTELAERLSARGDRFSQLLSKTFRDEYLGNELVTTSGLSEEERAELASLAESAHAAFDQGVRETTSSLRGLLAPGDPLYILSLVQTSNLRAAGATTTSQPIEAPRRGVTISQSARSPRARR
jgi:hypothetical protein